MVASPELITLWMKFPGSSECVGQVQPAQFFLDESRARRRESLWPVEGADMEMHLRRPAVALVGQGRAAGRAEAAGDSWRRGVAGQRSRREFDLLAFETRIGRDRRARVLATAVAMAIGRPLGRPAYPEAHRAAETAA